MLGDAIASKNPFFDFRSEHLYSDLLTPRRLNSTWISGPHHFQQILSKKSPHTFGNHEPKTWFTQIQIVSRSWATLSDTELWCGNPQCQNGQHHYCAQQFLICKYFSKLLSMYSHNFIKKSSVISKTTIQSLIDDLKLENNLNFRLASAPIWLPILLMSIRPLVPSNLESC